MEFLPVDTSLVDDVDSVNMDWDEELQISDSVADVPDDITNMSDDEAMELFERFDTEELTCEQMSYHISLLFTLALHVEANNLELLSRSKRRLINYFRIEHADIYLDAPLPIETIKTIETFFEGQIATC